jgi:ribosomal protein L40E
MKCRKCGTVYFRIKVEATRRVHHKVVCRVCGAEFKRRTEGVVYKYFLAKHGTTPGNAV